MNRAVILGIDPAATSGWALLAPSKGPAALLGHGTTTRTHKGAAERRRVVEAADLHARSFGVPLVVVREDWAGRWSPRRGKGGTNTRTVAGLGAAWGEWSQVLLERRIPHARIVKVTTGEWRRALFGVSRLPSGAWDAMAANYVRAGWGAKGLTDDEAEAVCVAAWGQHAPQIAEALR